MVTEMYASPWPILTSPLPYGSATFVVLLLTRNCNSTGSWQVSKVVFAYESCFEPSEPATTTVQVLAHIYKLHFMSTTWTSEHLK